jgi:hypothetical protein
MPSSALAAMIQPQLGAHTIMNGQPDKPAEDENALAAPRIGELAGNEIGQGFDNAKADDEGYDNRRRGNAEFFRPDQRHDRSLDPNHAADKGVDQDEQRELPPVFLEPEPDARAS